ncbi:MAG TPA: glycoside hydrolase family 15 protein [Polyangiaceae bacterium]|nr:glycoside hydrolase family 15 protein [Polyangiaceae bacterium]
MEKLELRAQLDSFYREVQAVIVEKQNPVSGLLPASTAITSHGDYTDAWVRDNVYSILAVWGLGLAYRSLDQDDGRGHELEQRTVFLMRGLLRSMMAQAHKVEAFKASRHPRDALHAKYDTHTGSTVVGDDAWGHLQIDATSVYLLCLAQMIASGLDIIWTLDEVAFVQNLVYYIERAYRTPDYGIWERGAKTNSGSVELNASSVGMAHAALEALSNFNLFGARGSHLSVIHVSPDNIAQSAITLGSMLPRESNTKEVDAALLSVIGFPAFAIHDPELRQRTQRKIVDTLEGRYGLKRFLLDGHQTAVEDEGRLHYEREELQRFEHIESEWPLFFAYLYLNAIFEGDQKSATHYETRLAALAVERGGYPLLPELYWVPEASVPLEKQKPGSQERQPNDNVPLVWAQSLYLLGRMIRTGLLRRGDLDPLGRRRHKRPKNPVVQVLFLAEDEALQAELSTLGVRAETLGDIEPVEVYLPEEIARAHGVVGKSPRLGLSGRTARALKTLTTSRFYRLDDKTVVPLASFFLERDFYLVYDIHFLLRRFRGELAYLHANWSETGRPTVTVLLTHALLETERDAFLALVHNMSDGEVDGVPVRLATLRELLPTGSYARLDGTRELGLPHTSVHALLQRATQPPAVGAQLPLSPAQLREIEAIDDERVLVSRLASSKNLFEQVEILACLLNGHTLERPLALPNGTTSLRSLLFSIYEGAGRIRLWAVARRAAGLLDLVDGDLSLAVAALLVGRKNIQVGRAYSDDSLITQPLADAELFAKIEHFCRDERDRVLTQELLLYLGLLIRARPKLFDQLLTVRVSHLSAMLTSQLAREHDLDLDEAYDRLMALAPSEVQQRLEEGLERYSLDQTLPQQLEHLRAEGGEALDWSDDLGLGGLARPSKGWWAWRQDTGVIDRRPENFYHSTFALFRHARALIVGDRLDRRNRIESGPVLSDMTPGEPAFAQMLEHLLNRAQATEYRQLTIEALTVLASFFKQNPTLTINDALCLDSTIGHAVRLRYLTEHPEHGPVYDEHKVKAWRSFYESAPSETSAALVEALLHLLEPGEEAEPRRSLSAED